MAWLLGALGLFMVSGLTALCLARSARWATRVGVGGAVIGCVLGLVIALLALLNGGAESLRLDWSIPYGSFFIEIDALSAFFLIPIFGLCGLAALYGGGYMGVYRGERALGASWFFFHLLTASMALVVLARNGVLFLICWEVMALASFFLVTFEDEREEVRQAGWTYLVATHVGTAFLLVFFMLAGREAGSLDFDKFSPGSSATASVLFLLAVIGFGTKAGFWPLHVWLPEAHPAAPSHVSAVMSGVMIKTGIYGLVRALTFLEAPPVWWGWLLIAVGGISGVLGVLFALAQHDLKRLLAYHSVENIGIIALGLGVGVVGVSAGAPTVAVLGFAGGLLHVLNHALFKGLLFFGAGSVLHSTGTREIEHLGGLLKKMPWTGVTFLVGAVAICGLPPLNGFVSEFFIYLGAFAGIVSLGVEGALPLVGVIGALAVIGGLAAACFAKAFGIVFLGEPRSEAAHQAHEGSLAMKIPLAALALGCLLVALLAPFILRAMIPMVSQLTSPTTVSASAHDLSGPLWFIVLAGLGVFALIASGALWRRWLLSRKSVTETVTWDCGYAQPTARMQYTASSFAQPITGLLASVLHTKKHIMPPQGFFPTAARLRTETPDLARERLYEPLFSAVSRGLERWRWLQHGQLQLYVLYIALALLVLLLWKLG
ncbi:Hydrogenase-4 component B [bacterium HR07]|nr:Hydrogenase-4 component B [bacterium HR07]